LDFRDTLQVSLQKVAEKSVAFENIGGLVTSQFIDKVNEFLPVPLMLIKGFR
jgi:hypothetical protein